jgi:signal recognition particle subunit SRP54
MFESLSEKLTGVFGKLSGKGKLSEQDIDIALREVRLALLEADVDFKVARSFIDAVRKRAVDEKVFASLTPGQTVVKIVADEMAKLLGGGETPAAQTGTALRDPQGPVQQPSPSPLAGEGRGEVGAPSAPARTVAGLRRADRPPSVVMLVGLQGSGKTTAAAKLGLRLKKEAGDRRAAPPVMLAACDLRRPAAIDQLVQLGAQLSIPVYHEPAADASGRPNDPVGVARRAMEKAVHDGIYWLILDTGGRLHIDDELMQELERVRDATRPVETLLVVDAMTGQDAVRSGSEFHRRIGLTGIILTKMDGDARGGAALSMRAVTGLPVKFIGTGEKPDALEEFFPERIASRILGMGDVQTLIEKAQVQFDATQAKKLEERLRKNQFDLNDLLEQFRALKKMGSLADVLGMIPGMGGLKAQQAMKGVDDKRLGRIEAIILSMTPAERRDPKLINGARRKRISAGSGTTPSEVNTLLDQYFQMQKMMKKIATPGGRRALAGMMRGIR